MLCRVLLAAIALSCTFAHDQGTPRALKDLICVLFLSGIQKEDLDVSLLKKLQHYNVDIDTLHDKKIQKECTDASAKPDHTEELKKYQNVEDIEHQTKKTLKNIDSKETRNSREEFYGLLKFWEAYTELLNKKKENNSKTKSIFGNLHLDTASQINSSEAIVTSDSSKESPDHKIDTRRLLNFWDTYKEYMVDKVEIKAKSQPKKVPRLIPHTSSKRKSNQVVDKKADINQILAKYLAFKYTFPDEPVTTTESQLIKTLVKKNKNIEEQLASSIAAINTLSKHIETLQNTVKERTKPGNVTVDYDNSSTNNTPLMRPEVLYDQEQLRRNTNVQDTTKSYTIIPYFIKGTDKDDLNGTTIDQDVIIRIAESVKRIVIKDLNQLPKRVVHTAPTTTTTLPTTTTVIYTPVASVTTVYHKSIPDVNNNSSSVEGNNMLLSSDAITHFLKLFKQFQKNTNDREQQPNDKVTTQPVLKTPVVMYHSTGQRNPYGTGKVPSQMPYMSTYQFPPIMAHPIDYLSLGPPIQVRPRYPHSPPVLIQTNSQDIKPIAVRLTDPNNMNMNIMLTTQNPLHYTKEQRDRWNFMMNNGRNPDQKEELGHAKDKLESYTNIDHNNAQQHKTNNGNSYTGHIPKEAVVSTEKYFGNINLKNGENAKYISQSNHRIHTDLSNSHNNGEMPPNLKSGNGYSDAAPYTITFTPKSRYLNEKYHNVNLKDRASPNYAAFGDKSCISQLEVNPVHRDSSFKQNHFRRYMSEYPSKSVVDFNEMQNIREQNEQRHKSKSLEYEADDLRLGQDFNTRYPYLNQRFKNYETMEGNSNNGNRHHIPANNFNNNIRRHGMKPATGEFTYRRRNPDDLEETLYQLTHFSSEPKKGVSKKNTERRSPMNVKGFHDKLEGNYNLEESIKDCGPDEACVMQVISRHQTPIVDARHQENNDSHFESFLKTQEKVNQMLERILATKNVPNSYEITSL